MSTHAALVRNARGGLEPRRFLSADMAAAAALERELAAPAEQFISHIQFAQKVGAPSQLIRAIFRRGGLPGAIAHSKRLLLVPKKLVPLARTYGLVRIERWAQSGSIPTTP